MDTYIGNQIIKFSSHIHKTSCYTSNYKITNSKLNVHLNLHWYAIPLIVLNFKSSIILEKRCIDFHNFLEGIVSELQVLLERVSLEKSKGNKYEFSIYR